MAINYPLKCAPIIDKRFAWESLTACAVNGDYEFTGVKTIKAYNIPATPIGNYFLRVESRYGAPEMLQNTTQEHVLSRARGFTFTFNGHDTNAGAALQRQLDEVVIPEIDVYRLSVIAAGAKYTMTGAITSSNAYSAILDAAVFLASNGCPIEGRVAFISPTFYKAIRLDPAFVKSRDIAQNALVKGQVGMVDGIRLILAFSSYLPPCVELLVTHPSATVGAQKLHDYTIYNNPPGINGNLVAGHVLYDAFVLGSKRGSIYVHKRR